MEQSDAEFLITQCFDPRVNYECTYSWRKGFSALLGRRVTTEETEDLLVRFRAMKYVLPEPDPPQEFPGFAPVTFKGLSFVRDRWASGLMGLNHNSYTFWQSRKS